MRFDKFGLIAIITGLLVLTAMMQFYFAWNWLALLMGIITGGILVFGLAMLLIGLLLIFL